MHQPRAHLLPRAVLFTHVRLHQLLSLTDHALAVTSRALSPVMERMSANPLAGNTRHARLKAHVPPPRSAAAVAALVTVSSSNSGPPRAVRRVVPQSALPRGPHGVLVRVAARRRRRRSHARRCRPACRCSGEALTPAGWSTTHLAAGWVLRQGAAPPTSRRGATTPRSASRAVHCFGGGGCLGRVARRRRTRVFGTHPRQACHPPSSPAAAPENGRSFAI